MTTDPASINLPLTKRYGRGGIDAALARHAEAERRREAAESKARRRAAREAEREAEANRRRFTADELRAAQYVRTDTGWHRVVRVSAKSVTVATPYSWTDRIALGKVRDFR